MWPFRDAKPSDLPVVLELLQTNSLPYQDITARHLANFLVVDNGETIAGFVGLERYGNDALLRSLAVRVQSRYSGLGTKLVRTIEARAAQSGVSALYLLTTTANEFFLHRGYKPIARSEVPAALLQSPEFSSLCPSEAVCLRKSLLSEHRD